MKASVFPMILFVLSSCGHSKEDSIWASNYYLQQADSCTKIMGNNEGVALQCESLLKLAKDAIDELPTGEEKSKAYSKYISLVNQKAKPMADTFERRFDTPISTAVANDIEILKKSEKSDGYGHRYVYVRVKNNTQHVASYLELTVTYYDKGGNIVGTGMGNTNNIAAKTERTITCLALNIENASTYQVEINSSHFL